MKKTVKRLLAMMLVVVMTIGAAPLSGFVGLELPEFGGFKKLADSVSEFFDGFGIKAKAEEYKSGNYFYSFDAKGNIVIRAANKTISGDITLPSTLDGYKVVGICFNGFMDCDKITSVTIPNSITEIGPNAFMGCNGLDTVILPNAISVINSSTFECCTNLSNIIIPDNVKTIGNSVFSDCEKLTSVTIGNGVTSIGHFAFSDCDSLTDVYYTGTVDEWNAISIGSNNEPLTNATIHFNYIRDDYSASGFCGDNLNWYFFDSTGELVISGAGKMYNYDRSSGLYSPWYTIRGNIKSVIIHGGVTYIGDEAFEASNLSDIIIPESVKGIGNRTFSGCKKLTNITIPNSVTKIGEGVFFGCQKLTTVNISDSIKCIEDSSFSNCTNLINITIPDSVTYIGNNAFSVCVTLSSLIIPNGVTSIGERALRGCKKLANITIPDSVTNIGVEAFESCDSLTDVYYGGSNKEWNAILIGLPNTPLYTATIHYNYVPESGETPEPKEELTIVSTLPANGAMNIKSDDDIVIVFSEDILNSIYMEDNNRIEVRKYSDDQPVFVFEDHYTSYTIMGNVLTLKNALNFTVPNQKYYIYIPYDAIVAKEDTSMVFSGITDKNSWSFTIGGEFNNKITETIDFETESGKGSVTVTFDGEWFEKSNTEYNHALAQFCADYAMIGYCYNEDDMKDYLSEMGFERIKTDMHTGRDEVNYFIASKDIVVNGEKETLVFAAFIGSYQKQWYSNFDPYGIKREKSYAGNGEKGDVHLGFADARDYVYAKLKSFITKNNIDKENMKLLLSGHSRGAATANLLAAKLIDETYANSSTALVNRNSIYTYTFATPNVASTQKNVFDSKYKCIFNIVNPEDFVTKVLPNSWGYYRYGKTYVLPSQTNDKNWKSYLKAMNKCFAQYKFGEIYDPYNDGEKTTYKIVEKFTKNINNLDEFYEKDIWAYNISGMIPQFMKPYDFFKDSLLGYLSEQNKAGGLNLAVAILLYGKTVYQDMIAYFFNPDLLLDASLNPGVDPGGKFKQAHQMETYCAYINAMTESQIKQTRLYYENTVNCPVDIEVYDNATNELVGKITNNVIDETVASKENAIVMDVEGDSKSFWLPSNGDYRVVLTGNDDGTMDYTVSNIDSDTGETERLNFFDVEIENGVSMEGEVNADEFVLDEYTLTHEEDGIIKPTEILVDEELKDISISVTTEGIGYTDGNITVTSGDYVTLNASTDEGNSFVGWYENDVLVSSDSAYSFVAKENRTLVARFSNNRTVVWDVDGETSVTYVKPGEAITVPENPVKDGYTFIGWTPSIPSVMPDEDMTFTAVFAFSATCPDCGQIFTDETAYNNHLETHKKISVSVISGMVIGGELKLGATITIKAEQIDGKVFKQWVAEGAKVADKNSAETTAVIEAGEITITAEYDDCECKCHKGGITAFFFKIVVFFQKLFGKNIECPCGAKH